MSITKKTEYVIADRMAAEIWRHEVQAKAGLNPKRIAAHEAAASAVWQTVEGLAMDLAGGVDKGFHKHRFLDRVKARLNYLKVKFDLEAKVADCEATIENGEELLERSRTEEVQLAIIKAKINREQFIDQLNGLEDRLLR